MGLKKLLALLALVPVSLGVACSQVGDDAADSQGAIAEESGPVDPAVAQGNDGHGSYQTEVWKVTHQWSETNPATGKTYEESYSDWVASLEKIKARNYGDTLRIKTPVGAPYTRELDAPTLECADTALFLRVTYSALMGLPFFVKSDGVYAGHFGMVSSSGLQHPQFGMAFHNYAMNSDWREGGTWRNDAGLRRKHAQSYTSGDETFVEESPGKPGGAGAWFDEFFVNKRVGHFLVLLIDLFGSVNLAQEGNMFHIVPEVTRPGDALLHRHGKYAPIGHTLFVYQVRTPREDRRQIEIVSGSMPARQASWEPDYQARNYFLSNEGGGPEMRKECPNGYSQDWQDETKCEKQLGTTTKAETASCPSGYEEQSWDKTQCVKYSKIPTENTDLRAMGGGIRRFRTPLLKGGRWLNIVPAAARDIYIADTDLKRVGDRLETWKKLLDLGTPAERITAAQAVIENAREYIRTAPSTCSKRTTREDAFESLYAAYSDSGEYDRAKIDKENRKLEDYVFAELDYDNARTCCWDSTKREHYDTIMQWANAEIAKGSTNQTCVAPPIFKATGGGDGFTAVRAFARSKNLPFPDAWNADEPCKATAPEDKLADRASNVDYCAANAVQPTPPDADGGAPPADGDAGSQ